MQVAVGAAVAVNVFAARNRRVLALILAAYLALQNLVSESAYRDDRQLAQPNWCELSCDREQQPDEFELDTA